MLMLIIINFVIINTYYCYYYYYYYHYYYQMYVCIYRLQLSRKMHTDKVQSKFKLNGWKWYINNK